ncbi:MAG: hypothetical protein AAFV72_08185 [Cyanobacteria bacterium J06635_1]
MATFVSSKQLREPPFITNPDFSLELSGREGEELHRQIKGLSKDLSPIQRLLRDEKALGLYLYLASLRTEAKSDDEARVMLSILDIAERVWGKLNNHFEEGGRKLEIPDACAGDQDDFMYTWSKNEHYLECEIFGNGNIEFFYRNRHSSEVWGEDTTLDNGFSNAIFEKLSIFA